MPILKIDPGHIRDAMEQGFIIPTTGKDKGKKRYASPNTQERIKSMCNLMCRFTNVMNESAERNGTQIILKDLDIL